MPSPFPGMNPYLEASTFWSAFHSRLIVAIADAVAPYLLPKYYIEIETRTYISSADNSLLVGIPDAVVFSPQSLASQISSYSPVTVRVATVPQPKRVILPMPEEVKERYLEVREVATGEAIAAIEVLSPKNKTAGPFSTTLTTRRSRTDCGIASDRAWNLRPCGLRPTARLSPSSPNPFSYPPPGVGGGKSRKSDSPLPNSSDTLR